MSELRSIKETKEAVDLVLTGVEIVMSAKADGKIGVEDLGLLLKLIPVVQSGTDGLGEIPAELADLSTEEAVELTSHVMAKLAITDVHARALAEAALQAAVANYKVVKAYQAMKAAVPASA